MSAHWESPDVRGIGRHVVVVRRVYADSRGCQGSRLPARRRSALGHMDNAADVAADCREESRVLAVVRGII